MNRFIVLIVCLVLTGCVTVKDGTSRDDSKASSRILKSADVDEQKIRKMISRFGPLIYLHPEEQYLMDDPEYMLDHGVTLNWGLVEHETDFQKFKALKVRSMQTSLKSFMNDVGEIKQAIESTSNPSDYRYWMNIHDSMKKGNMSRARAWVHVLPFDALSTEIQFWFFYPFNGPGRVEICASGKMCDDIWLKENGRHYGDWEVVSILVSNNAENLLGVYMSRHAGSETFFRQNDGKFRSADNSSRVLQVKGTGKEAHPVVYSAISSHAHYPGAGNQDYERLSKKKYGVGTFSVDLFDRTKAGQSFAAYHQNRYRIISSDMPGFTVQEPAWLSYDGYWGQYEKLQDKVKMGPKAKLLKVKVYTYKSVAKGPSGPKMKKKWAGAFQ
ncbi:MAG: Vps62-related protein [Proteobacteria bacterium]|nr:Vps62-related protein [Pseudomonadota bacterium]MBU1387327.1 Vps62-related protein [Pseudomonadota bacterium]MBU1544309.1 Vps62-related protein [Pseudomonadota bacterium]MBU2431472.1 Vps62-related protein [Pseudomonadota bacterium]MBU2480953.1 Vps62-related protein [Pseudomonadota bacterium]